ncbi:hypothetical protein GOODEAATRI_018820 [Goodea atripinnis]|uniref:Uncharacterized protein n=1 Tax=Goodea atripinnis TaxID=208336 RepID=A0ABV0NBQ4_9TELE
MHHFTQYQHRSHCKQYQKADRMGLKSVQNNLFSLNNNIKVIGEFFFVVCSFLLSVLKVHCLHHRSSFFCSDAPILLAPYLLFASPSLPPLFFSPVLPREAAENIFPQTVKRVLLKGKD